MERVSTAAPVVGFVGLALGVAAMLTGSGALGLSAGVCAALLGAGRWLTRSAPLEGSGRAAEPAPATETETETEDIVSLREAGPDVEAEPDAGADPLLHPSVIDALDISQLNDDNLIDPVTGLFSERYFKVALEARIAAARRRLRPVAVAVMEVVRDLDSDRQRPGDPDAITAAIRATLREADTASRMADGRYAIVLEDTPENGAIWTIERLRVELSERDASVTVWAGVACYPAHAFDTNEILGQAHAALQLAREWRQDRIEVATAD